MFGVVQLLVLEHRAGLEVVPQAERVADLVHRHFLDRLADQLVQHRRRRLLAVLGRVHGRQGHRRQRQLALHARAALAHALLRPPRSGPRPESSFWLGRSSQPATPSVAPQVEVGQAPAVADRLDRADRVGVVRRRGAAAVGLRLLAVEADHAGVEDDVGVDDLAGQRVGPRRPHGEAAIRRDPAEGVVIDVFRIEILVLLLAHLDGVAEADLLERLVPFQDALADVGPVLVRHRLLDPEDDLLLRGRQLVGVLRVDRLGPLQPPAVDVADEGGVLAVGAEVLDDAEEVADAVVGQARLVAVVGQLAQAVVDDDRGAAAVDDAVVAAAAAGVGGGHLQLDVARERLDLVPDAAAGVEVAAGPARRSRS